MEGALVCLSCGIPFERYHFLCSYFRIGGASIIAHTAHQINEEIHDKEVRLISAQGEQLGIMPLAEAMAKAGDADLDLVKISPNAVPPSASSWITESIASSRPSGTRRQRKTSGLLRSKKCVCPRESTSMISMSRSATPSCFLAMATGSRLRSLPWPGNGPYRHGKRLLEKFAADCAEVATMDQGAQAGWTSHDHVPVLPAEQRDQKVKSYKGVFRHA